MRVVESSQEAMEYPAKKLPPTSLFLATDSDIVSVKVAAEASDASPGAAAELRVPLTLTAMPAAA
jgi:hypothetical protein